MLSARDDIIDGRCELCRERIENEKLKKKQEQAQKTSAEDREASNNAKEKIEPSKLSIRLIVNKKVDSKPSDDGTAEMLQAKFLKHARSASPPIKVEKDDEPYSHEKLIESAKEAAHITKKQKRGQAGMSDWIPVKWATIDTKYEDEDDADSTSGSKEEEAHAKTESSMSTFGGGGVSGFLPVN
jgi:hypothetical protein